MHRTHIKDDLSVDDKMTCVMINEVCIKVLASKAKRTFPAPFLPVVNSNYYRDLTHLAVIRI